MKKVVGIRFKEAGKIYYFDPCNFSINKNDNVIVETSRGIEYGNVAIEPRSWRIKTRFIIKTGFENCW